MPARIRIQGFHAVGLLALSSLVGAVFLIGDAKPAYTHYPCEAPVAVAPVAAAPLYGPMGVRGQARRVSRRTACRTSRRR